MSTSFVPNKKLFILDIVFFSSFWILVSVFLFSTRNAGSAGFALLPIYLGILLVLFLYGALTSLVCIINIFFKKPLDSYCMYRLGNCLVAVFVAPFTFVTQSTEASWISFLKLVLAVSVFLIFPILTILENYIQLKKINKS